MGRNLSPMLRQEFENLDKDDSSRKSAMKALKSYVKDLDSKAIPFFLAQVSETKETNLTSGEYTISLYEVLARVHGPKIVPQINNIMSTIIKTLTSSVASFALHQACSKVVPAIARYAIDPTTPNDKKTRIIRSLCKPLSDSLLASQENLSSGAALCLKTLVDSDNWRYASSEIVNEVCQRVVGALEKGIIVNSHMGLAMALAKRNGLVVEAYARLLVRSGIVILNNGALEGNSQKRLVAIQMINFLMKWLDYKCIMSELSIIIEEMEKCEGDQMAYVKGAAFEAIQTAKRILAEKGSKYEKSSKRSSKSGDEDQSPLTGSPESRTMGSFGGSGSMVDSLFSTSFGSQNADSERKSVNRKLWRYENGGVNVSLKDGLFSGGMSTPRSVIENSENNGFSEFFYKSLTNGGLRSITPSPQKSRSYVDVDTIKVFTTPRKLVKSLQVPNEASRDLNDRFTHEDEGFHGSSSESVSSTDYIDQNENNLQELVLETKTKPRLSVLRILFGFIVLLFAFIVCFLWVGDLDKDYNLVPT